MKNGVWDPFRRRAASAILLIGHGTRDSAGIEEFLILAHDLGERLAPVPVYPCFLELASPAIDEAMAAAVHAGARDIIAAPVLLFAAGHAKADIPAALAKAKERLDREHAISLNVQQTQVLECHPKLLELSARRYAESLTARAAMREDRTCLVLVGRGSFDSEAIAAMHRFTALRAEMTPVARAETAFIAMASPKYGEVLRGIAEQNAERQKFDRIIVQPHLLFRGELLDTLHRDVTALADEFSHCEWIVTSHLGPDALLTDAVESICRAAIVRD